MELNQKSIEALNKAKKNNFQLVATTNGIVTIIRNKFGEELNVYKKEKTTYKVPFLFDTLHYRKKLTCPDRKHIASLIKRSFNFIGITEKIQNCKSISNFKTSNV